MHPLRSFAGLSPVNFLAMHSRPQTRKLLKRQLTEVWRFLRFLGCEASRAEDLAQETLLVLLDKDFEDRSEIATGAYLRRIAKNLYLKDVRRSAQQAESLNMEEAERNFVRQASGEKFQDYLEALRHCLSKITGRARKALELRYQSSNSRRQMAQELELSEDGVKSMLRRTREILRGCIEGRISE